MLEVTLQKIIGYSLHINQICIKIKQSFFALQVTAFFINTASTCTVSKLQHSNVLCQKKLSRPNPLTSSWSFSALVRIVVMCYNSLSNRKIWSGLRCERLITYKNVQIQGIWYEMWENNLCRKIFLPLMRDEHKNHSIFSPDMVIICFYASPTTHTGRLKNCIYESIT